MKEYAHVNLVYVDVNLAELLSPWGPVVHDGQAGRPDSCGEGGLTGDFLRAGRVGVHRCIQSIVITGIILMYVYSARK